MNPDIFAAARARIGGPINGTNLSDDDKRHNCRVLALNLLTLDDQRHNMSFFHSGGPITVDKAHYDCGTVACSLGWAPLFGFEYSPAEYFEDMGCRLFLPVLGINVSFSWCFGSSWENIDPGVMPAAARLLWFAEHGLPKNYEASSAIMLWFAEHGLPKNYEASSAIMMRAKDHYRTPEGELIFAGI